MPQLINAMVSELTEHLQNPENCVLAQTLRKLPDLLNKCTFENHLNLLYGISSSPDCLKILNAHELRSLLTLEAVNTISTDPGYYAGTSCLYWPALRLREPQDDGSDVTFFENLLESNLINVDNLSSPCTSDGDHKGCTPIFWFASSDQGRAFLEEHPTFLAEFTSVEALNSPVDTYFPPANGSAEWTPTSTRGQSTLSCLVYDEAKKNILNNSMLKLLEDTPELFSKTTAEGWNVCMARLSTHNKPALITKLRNWMGKFDAGKEMLTQIDNLNTSTENSVSIGRGIFTTPKSTADKVLNALRK